MIRLHLDRNAIISYLNLLKDCQTIALYNIIIQRVGHCGVPASTKLLLLSEIVKN